jgi:hypothetical protein
MNSKQLAAHLRTIMNAGSRASASLNPTLTNFAVGFAQDVNRANRLADFLAPEAEVPAGTGYYKSYSDKAAFQVYQTLRPIGGRPTTVAVDASDVAFNCKPNGLQIAVDDSERDAAGDAGSRLDEAKIRTVINVAAISREKATVDLVVAALTAVGGKGAYSDANVDPIDEIDGEIDAINTRTGMMPNRIALGLSMWRKIKNHPKVKARFGTAGGRSPSLEEFCAQLLNPGIIAKVGVLGYDTAKLGNSKSATQVLGGRLIVFLGSDAPDQYDPSLAKTFTTRKGSVDSVLTVRDEVAHSDFHQVLWSEDAKVTSAIAGSRIDLA